MENSKIIDWILKNKETFKLKVINITGLREILNEYHDFVIEIEINQKTYSGRGTDIKEESAFLKAFSESIERYFATKYSCLTTSGIAVHYDVNECIKNAKAELIERDIFLCHFLLGGKLNRCENDLINKFQDKLVLRNINIEFYRMHECDDSVCIISFIKCAERQSFDQIFFGVSFNKCIASAIEQSAIEALRDFLSVGDVDYDLSVEEFDKLKNWNLVDHRRIGLNADYAKKYFESRVNDIDLKIEYVNEIEVGRLTSDEIPSDMPLVCFRATCNKAQSLWVGTTTPDKINQDRIKQISRGLELFKVPHFFN